MKKSLLSVAVLSIILLGGCAVKKDNTQIQGLGLTYHSDVTKLANGDYFTEVEAAPFAGRVSGATGQAIKNAVKHCNAQDKAMKEIKSETDSHWLINGVSRLTFRCI